MHYAPHVITLGRSKLLLKLSKPQIRRFTTIERLYQLAERAGPNKVPSSTYDHHTGTTPVARTTTPRKYRRRNSEVLHQPATNSSSSPEFQRNPHHLSIYPSPEPYHPSYLRREPKLHVIPRTHQKVDLRLQQRLKNIRRSIRNEHRAIHAINHIEYILSECRLFVHANTVEEELNAILFNVWA